MTTLHHHLIIEIHHHLRKTTNLTMTTHPAPYITYINPTNKQEGHIYIDDNYQIAIATNIDHNHLRKTTIELESPNFLEQLTNHFTKY